MAEYTVVPAQEMKRIITSDATILDVRNIDEHDEQRLAAPHALVPLPQLDPDQFMLRRGLDRDAPVYMLCKAGMRARKAADQFLNAGYTNIFVIDGGIMAVEGDLVLSGGSEAAPKKPSAGGCA